MPMVPDLNRIAYTVADWQCGLLSTKTTQKLISGFVEPESLIPETELIPDPKPDFFLSQVLVLQRRLEPKLNLVIKHLRIPLPDELNPDILSAEARELAERGDKIAAIKVHRDYTGMGLAKAKDLIEAYLRERRGEHNPDKADDCA